MLCTIILDNNDCEYCSESIVEGKVIFTFGVSETVRNIVVQLIGEEETKWLKTVDNDGQQANTECEGKNRFCILKRKLSQGGVFDAGTYEFPFKFGLAKRLPGTYTCKAGCVKFFIKVVGETLLTLPYWVARDITVISPIYIEELDKKWLVKYFDTADRTDSSMWCVSGGSVTMDVSMTKRAFARNEFIEVKVDINSTYEDKISRVVLVIGQIIEAKAWTPKDDSKTEDKILVSKQLDVNSKCKRSYTFSARVPSWAVIPNFNLCQLFSQKCYMKVTAVAQSYNLTVSTYIVIGNHHPAATISNNDPVEAAIDEQEEYNLRATAPPISFQSPPLPPTSILDDSYPLIDDLDDSLPSYDVVVQKVTEPRDIAKAAAEFVPSAPPQYPPTAPPLVQDSTPYPPVPLSEKQNMRPPYPTGDPLAEWTRNRSVTEDITTSGGNAASGEGAQADVALYPPPLADVAHQKPSAVSFIPMPMPQHELYLPPMLNVAPYPNVPSSLFTSMPLPTSEPYHGQIPMPMPQGKLYLPPVLNIAPYSNVLSSSNPSMPFPTLVPYPPGQQEKMAPYPTEDPLVSVPVATDVTYSATLFPSVPEESPTIVPAAEAQAELSNLPTPSKGSHAYA